MLKLSCGYLPHRQAHVVGLGLTDGNLQRLLDNKPMRIVSEDLDLPAPGVDFGIIAAVDQDGVKARLEEMLSPLDKSPDDPVRVTALVFDHFCVMPMLHGESSRPVYIIALTEKSFEHLRQRKILTFRARPLEGDATPVEVFLFWGATEEVLEENFYASGLIKRGKTVIKRS